ncbi:Flp pilus assembly protein CpaB [Aurantiacibacter luteus]|uniref:SAF domain-containing protein n=1 Tax=Aurantiacibacter luteus TaxID=1581420 RepID=A0A0G9MPL7_9SPHN|nr:Flp pilus assembly protein CpaB [Aurantiacibacter luteus]KLE31238.1 hypothetical protein AAW00_13805 [Aurantiacibacter luteus]
MGGRNLAILAVAIVLGIFAVIIANAWFSGQEEKQQQIAEELNQTRIVVASQPMEFGSALTQENLRLQNFPANSVPAGAFTSIEQAMQGGRVALRPIVPGEPVLADKVSGSGGRAVLSALLENGARAVSIPISPVTGVSGFVRPGDIVDVMLTRQIPGDGAGSADQMVDIIMEGVKVLAIDQVSSEAATEPGTGSTAVVEVDQRGAQVLTLANRVGQLSLALRNVENQVPGQLATVTTRDLGNSRIYLAGRREPATAPAPAQQPIIIQQAPVAAAPQQAAPAQAPAVRSGRSMEVIRGTDTTDYPVGRLGSR